MNAQENINAPKVNAITHLGVSDMPFTGGALLFKAMKMIKDLGRLYPKEDSKQKRHYAIYECPYCGKHFISRTDVINCGTTVSCGCYNNLMRSKTHKKHGFSHTRIGKCWQGMISRCYYEKHVAYKNYGDRGITVCNEWKNDFMQFYDWAMMSGYADNLQIDRKDNDKGYSPENCRWVIPSINCQNRRMRLDNTSGYKGVFKSRNGNWITTIGHQAAKFNLGTYLTPQEAAIAYNNFVIQNKTNHILNPI